MIKLLSPDTISKIAAGEVIIRPVSVVKELIENAIDANSSHISINIKNNARNIKVADNGIGINPDDLELAVTRYATSKIRTIEDLSNIFTLGFRGEALASIGVVSRLKILSSPDSMHSAYILVEDGKIIEKGHQSRKKGTTIEVKELFFNMPVRLNQLKSTRTEERLIKNLIKKYALIYSDITFEYQGEFGSFIYIKNSWEKRIKDVLKNAFELIPIKEEGGLIDIEGFIEKPSKMDIKKREGYVYFNLRPVKYNLINHIVQRAYFPTIPEKARPFYLLSYKVDPNYLDVNIHPGKEEVKFTSERFLVDLTDQIIRKALGFKAGWEIQKKFTTEPETVTSGPLTQSFLPGLSLHEEEHVNYGKARMWQAHSSYIIAETSNGLLFIDQHAAHERILYEKFLSNNEIPSQGLLFPITITVDEKEYKAYLKVASILKRMGLKTRDLKKNTIVIEAIPADAHMKEEDIKTLFSSISEAFQEVIYNLDFLAKQMACKAAIKKGDSLKELEMEKLLSELFLCRDPYHCPHGRPTLFKITTEELDRRFGRI